MPDGSVGDFVREAGRNIPAQMRVIAAILAVATVVVVVADPYVSEHVPPWIWHTLHLENSPYKLVPVLAVALVGATAAAWALWRCGSVTAVGILILLSASQATGLRAGPLDLLDVSLLSIFFVWTASRVGDAESTVTLGTVVWGALALIILNFPNILHGNPVVYVGGSIGLVRCLVLALLVINLVSSPRYLDLAIRVFVAVAVASAIIGILQFVAGYLFGAYFTLIDPPETAFKPTPIGMVMRSSALSITAQHYSGFLTLSLPFILFAAAEKNARSRAAQILALVTVLVGILASWNFGAIYVAAAVISLFPFFRWPHLSIQVFLGYALAAGTAYFTGIMQLLYELSFGDSGVAKGVSQRKTLMELGLTKLYRDPWIGEGAHGMARFSGNFWHRPVHNAYVQTMTEIGMVGGWVLIGMLLVLVTQLFLVGKAAQGKLAVQVRASLMSVLALMILMMSEPMMDHTNTWLMLGMAQGALLIAQRGREAVSTRYSTSG